MIPEIEVVDHLQDLKDLKGVKLVCSTREKEKTLKIINMLKITLNKFYGNILGGKQ